MGPMIWAAMLLAGGVLLVVLEVFIPSGGLLGTLAAVAVVAAIVLAFQAGPLVGLVFVFAAVIGLPMALSLALRWWPHTPFGRRILLRSPTPEEVAPQTAELQALRALLGRKGRARSPMLPAGAVTIDSRVVNAVSEGMPIETGQWVEVIAVRGNVVVVRAAAEEVITQAGQPRPLDEPIDVDPFEDSAA